jgi:hypothetical protein
MSENFGVNTSGFDQTSAQTGDRTYTSLVEDHASLLMDELFQELDAKREDLEQTLPVSASTTPMMSSAASQLALAVKTDELEDNLLIPYVEMDAILEPFYGVEPEPADKTERPLGSYLWLATAWGAFLGSASLLAFTQFNSFTRSPAGVQAAVPAIAAAQPQDIAFATELSESLKSAETIQPLPTSAAVAALPTIMPPAALRTEAVSAATALPPVTTPPFKAVGTDQKSKSSAAAKLQPPPTIALSSRLPVLTRNQAQTTTAFVPPSLPPSLVPQAMPMGRQAQSGVTVQGILDLGSKSAMLISRNGSTQNIRPGEVLDSTGWVFVRVENGQAILQRGNETRTVSGGEQF